MFKAKPYICDFSMFKDVNGKRACRFAAGILFPEEALNHEIRDYCRDLQVVDFKSLDFNQVASFIIVMTVKYQLPLKAVIYRLEEEHFIDNVKNILKTMGL